MLFASTVMPVSQSPGRGDGNFATGAQDCNPCLSLSMNAGNFHVCPSAWHCDARSSGWGELRKAERGLA